MTKSLRRLCRGSLLLLLTGVPVGAHAALEAEIVEHLRRLHADAAFAVADTYFEPKRIDKVYHARMGEVAKALGEATTVNNACLAMADSFLAVDPTIRFYELPHAGQMDYGWTWRMVGDEALVTQVDQSGDARAQGVRVGDRVILVEGAPLRRSTHRMLVYGLNIVAPRERLRVVVQSPGGEPRSLTLAARAKARPKGEIAGVSVNDGLIPLKPVGGHTPESRDEPTIQPVGDILVWRASDLGREPQVVKAMLERTRESSGLVVDLRGQYVFRYDTMLGLLDGLLAGKMSLGKIERPGPDIRLSVRGNGQFKGRLVVLTDAATAGFAEVLTWAVQQAKRGQVLGDRTLGQVRQESMAVLVNTFSPKVTTRTPVIRTRPDGTTFTTYVYTPTAPAVHSNATGILDLARTPFDPTAPLFGVRVPVGRVVLADGTDLHGVGVTPDVTLLPTGEDLAGRRDVVLARALALLGQTVTPEDAYKLFRNDWDDDEIILDQTALY